MKRTAICLVLFVMLVLPVFSQNTAMPPLAIPTAASSGFGGSHIAFTDNVFALLVNPAALMRVQQRSFVTFAPSIMNPQFLINSTRYTLDVFSSLSDDGLDELGETMGKLSDELGSMDGKIALGLELRELPLSFAWVANGFGFGIWNRTFVNANLQGIWVSADVYEDIIVPVGFAFKILQLDNHTIDAGISLKPFFRGIISEQEIATDLIDDDSDFTDRINVPLMTGFGFDLGLLYRSNTGFSAGLTFTDIFTRGNVFRNLNPNLSNSGTYYIPFAINMGLAYNFRIGNFMEDANPILNSLGFTVAFDWRNMLNAFQQFLPSMQENYLNRNTFLDIGVGLQVSLFDMFKFRVGMNDMLPAVGIGFNLGSVEIDLAYYGKEFGREPGLLPTAMVDISISFRPQAKERDWLWTRRSVVGLIAGGEMVSEIVEEMDSDF